jgi:hypothetical protein
MSETHETTGDGDCHEQVRHHDHGDRHNEENYNDDEQESECDE